MSVRNWTAASTLSADRRSQPLSVNRWGYACPHMIGCIANPNDWIFRSSATVGKVVNQIDCDNACKTAHRRARKVVFSCFERWKTLTTLETTAQYFLRLQHHKIVLPLVSQTVAVSQRHPVSRQKARPNPILTTRTRRVFLPLNKCTTFAQKVSTQL